MRARVFAQICTLCNLDTPLNKDDGASFKSMEDDQDEGPEPSIEESKQRYSRDDFMHMVKQKLPCDERKLNTLLQSLINASSHADDRNAAISINNAQKTADDTELQGYGEVDLDMMLDGGANISLVRNESLLFQIRSGGTEAHGPSGAFPVQAKGNIRPNMPGLSGKTLPALAVSGGSHDIISQPSLKTIYGIDIFDFHDLGTFLVCPGEEIIYRTYPHPESRLSMFAMRLLVPRSNVQVHTATTSGARDHAQINKFEPRSILKSTDFGDFKIPTSEFSNTSNSEFQGSNTQEPSASSEGAYGCDWYDVDEADHNGVSSPQTSSNSDRTSGPSVIMARVGPNGNNQLAMNGDWNEDQYERSGWLLANSDSVSEWFSRMRDEFHTTSTNVNLFHEIPSEALQLAWQANATPLEVAYDDAFGPQATQTPGSQTETWSELLHQAPMTPGSQNEAWNDSLRNDWTIPFPWDEDEWNPEPEDRVNQVTLRNQDRSWQRGLHYAQRAVAGNLAFAPSRLDISEAYRTIPSDNDADGQHVLQAALDENYTTVWYADDEIVYDRDGNVLEHHAYGLDHRHVHFEDDDDDSMPSLIEPEDDWLRIEEELDEQPEADSNKRPKIRADASVNLYGTKLHDDDDSPPPSNGILMPQKKRGTPIDEYWGLGYEYLYPLEERDDFVDINNLVAKIVRYTPSIIKDLKWMHAKRGHWIWFIFPTTSYGRHEPYPKTRVSTKARMSFIEMVPEEWFNAMESITDLLVECNYDILRIFHPADLRRVRSFVEQFRKIEWKIDDLDLQESEGHAYDAIIHVRERLVHLDNILGILEYCGWPDDVEIRECLLHIEHLPIEKHINSKWSPLPVFKIRDEASPAMTASDIAVKFMRETQQERRFKKSTSNLGITGKSSNRPSINTTAAHAAQSWYRTHCRLGHQGDSIVRKGKEMASMPGTTGVEAIKTCQICDSVKIYRSHRTLGLPNYLQYPPGSIVSMDIHGPMKTCGFQGERFWLVFAEWKTEMGFVFPMKRKSDSPKYVKVMARLFKKHGRKLMRIFADNDTVFLGSEFDDECVKYEITLDNYPKYTPNGNLSELKNKQLEPVAVCSMRGGCAPEESWPWAVQHAKDLINAVVKSKSKNPLLRHLSPLQLWNLPNEVLEREMKHLAESPETYDMNKFVGQVDKVNWNYFRTFWARAYELKPGKRIGDMDSEGRAKPTKMHFVGVSKDYNAFKLLDMRTFKTSTTISARFVEETDDIRDQLTGLQMKGGAEATVDRDLAQRIIDSWNIEGNQTLDVISDDEEDEEFSDDNEPDISDDGSEEEQEKYPAEEELAPANGDVGARQADHSGDLVLLKQMMSDKSTPSGDAEELDDGNRRTLRAHTQRTPIRRSFQYRAPGKEHHDLVRSSKEKPSENDDAYLRRIQRDNTPVSFTQLNPKTIGTKTWQRYENFKHATTITEARNAGATWGCIRDDYARGYLKIHPHAELRRLNDAIVNILFSETKMPWLVNSITRQDKLPGPVLFYSHDDPYPEFSMHHMSTFFMTSEWTKSNNKIEYSCGEQALMSTKALVMQDTEANIRIMASSNPNEMKAIGRSVTNFDEAKWSEIRNDVLVEINMAKFGQNDKLKAKLLNTAPAIIAEASLDELYGTGIPLHDPRIHDMANWFGANILGSALMQVREQLSPVVTLQGLPSKHPLHGQRGIVIGNITTDLQVSSEEEDKSQYAHAKDLKCSNPDFMEQLIVPPVINVLADHPKSRLISLQMNGIGDHPSDQLKVVKLIDDDYTNRVVVPERALLNLTIDKERFISRNEMLELATSNIMNLLEKDQEKRVLYKHSEFIKNCAEDQDVRILIDAVTEATKDLKCMQVNEVANEEKPDVPRTPINYDDAILIDADAWCRSMSQEIGGLIDMEAWELMRISDLQPGDNIMGQTWTYRVKSKEQGYRKKSRCCGQGFSQKYGSDFYETYSSVVGSETLRIAIALAAGNNRILHSYDIKNAYLYAKIPEADRIFMRQPKGFSIDDISMKCDADLLKWYVSKGLKVPANLKPGEELVCRIRRALYGLKSSARLYKAEMTAWFVSENFIPLSSDDCVFVYRESNKQIDVEAYIYVDDILVSVADEASADWFKDLFYSKWKSSPGSGGLAKFLLGMDIIRCPEINGVILSQQGMIEEVAKKHGCTSGRTYATPMTRDFDPSYGEGIEDLDTTKYPYRSIVGAILFIVTHTRADCSTACNMLCTAMQKPQRKHWDAALRLLSYLFQTRTLGLCYTANTPKDLLNKPYAHVDASHAGEKGSRSRLGWTITLNGATVAFSSKLISSICLSSAEAETTAAVDCLKTVIWVRTLLYELGYIQPGSTEIFEDSTAMIGAASNNSQTKQSRYYQLRTAFIRHLIKSGVIHLTYVNTNNQTADMLSKNLAMEQFVFHQPGILGVQPKKGVPEDK